MLKKLLSFSGLVILLFINTVALSQTDFQDVVYLKNGSIIRGMIIEQIPNKSLKIETADKNIFVFQIEEIEKITKEPAVSQKKSNYSGGINLGYAFGVGDFGMDFIKFTIYKWS